MPEAIAKRNGLDALIEVLAKNSPDLGDLNVEQLKGIGKAVIFDELKSTLQKKVQAHRINFSQEKFKFLDRSRSEHTRHAYFVALTRLQAYCDSIGISPTELTPRTADDFIIQQRTGSPASVRLIVSGCSAFFTWLERRHQELKNPFRGTRERPRLKSVRPLEVPTREEIEIVIRECDDDLLRAGFVILLEYGFRVGALPGLVIRNGRYTTTSKGKEISGRISEKALEALGRANLNSPFGNYTDQQIKDALQYQINRLWKVGAIKTRFSPHDIRHRFAIDFYEKTKDIYRLKLALFHSSISVTEGYLKGLGRGGGKVRSG